MKRPTFISIEQLKVAGVILVALAVLGVAMVKLGQTAKLFTERYELVTFLPSANGLREGGSVTVAGQLAGTVKSIRFLPVDADTTRNLVVTIELDEALREQVREDSRARLRTLGLLGDKVVDVSPGTPQYRVLRDGETLPIAQTVDYESVLVQASGAVGDMVQLTHDLRALTGGLVRGEGTAGQLLTNRALYDELNGTLARTSALLGRLQSPNGTVGRLLDDPALYQNLTAMVGSVDTLVRQLNSTDGTLGRLMRDDSLYTNLVGITSGADSLMKALTQGDGFANRMLTDQLLYDRLNKTITDLAAILEDVRRNPGKYTKGMIKVF